MTRPGRPGTIKIVGGLAAVVLVGLVLAAGLGRGTDLPDSGLPITKQPDRPAPDLTGTTLSGEPFDLSRHRGSVVVLNVMASWCTPCRDEVPVLAEGADRFAGRDVRFVGVAMRDDPEDTRELLARSGAQSLTVLMDPDGVAAVTLGARGVPETFVVDRSGTIRLHAFGPVSAAWLDQWIPVVAS